MIISWNTTKRCNLYCKHCYRESGPEVVSPNELTTAEGKKLLSEIQAAGFKIMIFSGGEPLLRPDILELTQYAKEIGLRPVFGTNGTLITKEMAAALKEADAAGVAISLDSTTADFHDAFRQVNGCFAEAIQGIKNSLEAGIRVQVNMTLTEQNFDQFEAMADYVLDLGVQALHPFFLVPTGRGKDMEEEGLKKERYFNMIRTVLEKQKTLPIELKPTCAPQFMPLAKEMGVSMRFSRGCLAGVGYCCILPDGEVHICPYLPVKVGNVREQSFDQIWRESEIFNRLRDYTQYEGRCGECGNMNICGGCRARAYYYNDGNYMAEEPWCYQYAE